VDRQRKREKTIRASGGAKSSSPKVPEGKTLPRVRRRREGSHIQADIGGPRRVPKRGAETNPRKTTHLGGLSRIEQRKGLSTTKRAK